MPGEKPTMRGSRLLTRMRAMLIVVVSLIALWWLMRGQRTLLERSVVVCPSDGIESQWLSDHELLLFKHATPVSRRQWPGGDAREYYRGWSLTRLDTSTGIETPLTAVSAWFPHRADAPYNAAVSPDGRWLLWRKGVRIVAARLDGTQRQTWDDSANPANCMELPLDLPQWRLDSRHFCELLTRHVDNFNRDEYIGGALIRDVQNPKAAQVVEIPHYAEFGHNLYFETPHVTLTGDVFSAAPANVWSPTKTLLLVPLQAGQPARKFSVKAPAATEFNTERSDYYTAVALSPHGDRIAWNCVSPEYVPPLLDLLHRIFPGQQVFPTHTLSLWTSRLDGSDMTEIGEIIITKKDALRWIEPRIMSLRWLPSGKALSFIYQGTLYRVETN